jgi:menaquinone-dependent protoporphyrinogen oxidase
MSVLVAYASAFGSTAEIAKRIASRVRDAVNDVECRPVDDVEAASGYDAVILGSAIHNQKWLPAAVSFVSRFSAELEGMPVWCFSVGMSDGLPKFLRARGAALQQERLAQYLRPQVPLRGHKLFSGVYQAAQMPAMLRGLFRLTGGRFGDLRDWDAIDAWADEVSGQLAGPPSPATPSSGPPSSDP